MNDRKAAGWSRRDFLRAATVAGTAGFLGLGSEAVEAQQPAKVPRIAYLGATSLTANAARVEAFRQGLRELGYIVVDRKPLFFEKMTRLNFECNT